MSRATVTRYSVPSGTAVHGSLIGSLSLPFNLNNCTRSAPSSVQASMMLVFDLGCTEPSLTHKSFTRTGAIFSFNQPSVMVGTPASMFARSDASTSSGSSDHGRWLSGVCLAPVTGGRHAHDHWP